MTSTLEIDIIKYVGECSFPGSVFEHFGRYREPEIKAAIENAVSTGKLVETWFDDRACGGVRYSTLSAPKSVS